MSSDQLRDVVPEGEALRYTSELRTGGVIGLTDDRLLILRGDDPPVSVEHRDVDDVEFQDFDYFVGVLSVVLVGFGILSTRRNLVAGIGLAAAGVVSLYVSYRKRDRAMVNTHSRPKPLVLYPVDASTFYDAYDRRLEPHREAEEAG